MTPLEAYEALLAGRPVPATVVVVPLNPDDAKELARLGRKVAEYTERRNAKIREVIAGGAGPREIARAVGLNHATVLNIVKPRKR